MYRKTGLLLVFYALSFWALGQQKFITKFEIEPSFRKLINEPTTAVVFKSNADLGDFITLTVNGEKVIIPFDPDAPDFTYFKSMDGQLIIRSISSESAGSIHLINTGTAPKLSGSSRTDQEVCDFTLDPIPQSDWRNGLPAPSYSRTFTDVEHVIVHHSAGSNTATNYTQVVRDIYIYHTQSNGWSDIGYNYLIAQNGALYAGRDPGSGEQDNVMGAHFCGRNSTTMGVCLLGNYQTAEVSSDTWMTLQQVAAFKLQKENLDPTASASHPLGNIGHIAGHRDGCSTLCPGQDVYDQLAILRTQVDDLVQTCGRSLEISLNQQTIDAGEQIAFENLSSGYDSFIWHFDGGNPALAYWSEGNVTYDYAGVFDVRLIGIVGDLQDTLEYDHLVVVRDELSIFPNPTSALSDLSIATDRSIIKVKITGLDGKLYYNNASIEEHGFQVPPLRQGLYLMEIYTDQGLEKRKLVIN